MPKSGVGKLNFFTAKLKAESSYAAPKHGEKVQESHFSSARKIQNISYATRVELFNLERNRKKKTKTVHVEGFRLRKFENERPSEIPVVVGRRKNKADELKN